MFLFFNKFKPLLLLGVLALTSNMLIMICTQQTSASLESLANQQSKLPHPLTMGKWESIPGLTDEFDGKMLDLNKWDPKHFSYSTGSNDVNHLTFFHSNNVVVANGQLHLILSKGTVPGKEWCQFLGANLHNKTWARYGYFEIKARLAKVQANNAFWFIDDGKRMRSGYLEYDITESSGTERSDGHESSGSISNQLNGNVWIETPVHTKPRHSNNSDPDNFVKTADFAGASWQATKSLSDQFNIIGWEWGKDYIRTWFNGVCVEELTKTNHYYHYPMQLILYLNAYKSFGGLPRQEELPASFDIEYVRSWRRTDIVEPPVWNYEFTLVADTPGTKNVIKESGDEGKIVAFIKPNTKYLGLDYINDAFFAKEKEPHIMKRVAVNDISGKTVYFNFEWKKDLTMTNTIHGNYALWNVNLDTDPRMKRGESSVFVITSDAGPVKLTVWY